MEQTVWSPQAGPQKALIDCPVYEIFYGGARGGGKTDGVLGKMGLKAGRYGSAFNCVFFRRELPQLDDAIERSKSIYGKIGASYHQQSKTWRFPTGGRLRFRPLENISDSEKYQGQNLSDACIEEAGNFPDPSPIQRLHACLRSAAGVPVQMHLTGNPGGPGQQWIKARYIDPAPRGMRIIKEEIEGVSRERVYIPAKVWDNKILLANDPRYIASLHLVGSEQLVKAWLRGDWDVIEGAFFDCWGDWKALGGIIRPVPLPKHWVRFRSMDWGSARPFSVGWWAVVSEQFALEDGAIIPEGALVRYREWYGVKTKDTGEIIPNVGLKMTAEDVARGIVERDDADERIDYSVIDPACFAENGGPSIASRMYTAAKVLWKEADNKRVADVGHMGGWDQLRARFVGDNGVPMIYCFDTCRDSIRTIPALQHDSIRAEDIDSDGEDHAGDEWRYACMSRPYTRTVSDYQDIVGHSGRYSRRKKRAQGSSWAA